MDLQIRKIRTAAERGALVEDTVELLLAVHHRLGLPLCEHTPDAPAKAIRSGVSLADAFVPWAEHRVHQARLTALKLATELVAGAQQIPWYATTETVAGQSPASLAMHDAEGLRKVLDHLQVTRGRLGHLRARTERE